MVFRVLTLVYGFRRIVSYGQRSRLSAKHLKYYVVADGVYERAEAFRILEPVTPKDDENAKEGLLARIFDQLRRTQPGSKLDEKEVTEVRREMLLDMWVAIPQPCNVVLIEGTSVHALSLVPSMVVQS
jgi:hypothetical protein